MNDKIRGPVLGALREIYDGGWVRQVGTDGGKTLAWKGKVAIIAGCTDAIDLHYVVMASMGQRFLFYRLPKSDAFEQGKKALALNTQEDEMREELRTAVCRFFAGKSFDHLDATIPEDIVPLLIHLAILAVESRSPIERDTYSREITLVPDPEAPARFVKCLGKLWVAFKAIGVSDERAWLLIKRLGLDTIPRIRYRLLQLLMSSDVPQKTGHLASAIAYPNKTTLRALEDLAGLKLVERDGEGQGTTAKWQLTLHARTLYASVTSRDTRVEYREIQA